METPPKQPVTDYVTVPAGTYRCRVAEVREGETRRGDNRWSLRLEVSAGEFEARTAAWDALTFSEIGRHRAAFIFDALGVGQFAGDEVLPKDLVGCEAMVTIRPDEYLGADGVSIVRNQVTFDGWEALAR